MLKKLFQVKKIKYGPAEVEFFGDIKLKNASSDVSTIKVDITALAQNDIKALSLKKKEVLKEISHTIQRHPRLLDGSFESLPLQLSNITILISYAVGSNLSVERILPTAGRSPLFNEWAQLLSMYRRVASLSYRRQNTDNLWRSSEAKRTIYSLSSLLAFCKIYLRNYKQCYPQIKITWDTLIVESMLEEIEFSINNGQIGDAVARAEILLSNIHRMILICAPTDSIGNAMKALGEIEFQSEPVEQGDRILIIDDEEGVIDVLRDFLELKGFEVDVATDGIEALKILATKRYNIVVSDWMMPGLNGIQVVQMAKILNSIGSSIGISAFFSGKDIKDPFDVVLEKPFNVEELLKSLHLLKKKATPDDNGMSR